MDKNISDEEKKNAAIMNTIRDLEGALDDDFINPPEMINRTNEPVKLSGTVASVNRSNSEIDAAIAKLSGSERFLIAVERRNAEIDAAVAISKPLAEAYLKRNGLTGDEVAVFHSDGKNESIRDLLQTFYRFKPELDFDKHAVPHTLFDSARNNVLVYDSPLHVALRNGEMDTAASIISTVSGVVDAVNKDGKRPFVVADVNCVDSYGNTALHYAASVGSKQDVLSLVQRGAKLDIENVNGNTPLDIAEQVGNTTVMTILDSPYEMNRNISAEEKKNAAIVNTKDDLGGDLEWLDKLLSDDRSNIEIDAAAIISKPLTEAYLERNGLDGDELAVFHSSGKHISIGYLLDTFYSHTPELDFDKHAVPHTLFRPNNFDELFDREFGVVCRYDSPLHVALRNGEMDTAASIIGLGQSVANAVNENGERPFDLADVNCVDSYGNTALHYAASLGSERDVISLVQRGANVDIENANGHTPFDLAYCNNEVSSSTLTVLDSPSQSQQRSLTEHSMSM